MFDMTKKNLFQKADYARKLVRTTLQNEELTDTEIMSILGKAESFNRGIIKRVSVETMKVLNVVLSKGITPNCLYKNVKMSLMPVHIKEKIYGRRISNHKAMRVAFDEGTSRKVELENTIFEFGMKAISSLNRDEGGEEDAYEDTRCT